MTAGMHEPPMRAAWRFARALGLNFIPTTLDREPLVEGYPAFNMPGAPAFGTRTLVEWRDREKRDLARGRETMAWALLPASNRIVVLGGDSPEWTERLLERQPTPLVVRSPTPGRAHLYYRWPDGVDLVSGCNVAGRDTYDLRARKGTIHAPGSMHHSRKGRYVCELPAEEQIPGLRDRLPELDLAHIEEDKRVARAGRPEFVRSLLGIDRWSTNGDGERQWSRYLRNTPPAQQGARQATLFRVARRASDFGVPEPSARPGLLAWAAQCAPPLDPVEVVDALKRAYLSRQNPIGCDLIDTSIRIDI